MPLPFSSNAFNRYLVATTTYGFCRKVIKLKDATVEKYDIDTRTYKKMPMLTTDKMLVVTLGTLPAMYGWPMYLYNDIRLLECVMKGLDPRDYYINNDKKYVSDYLLE